MNARPKAAMGLRTFTPEAIDRIVENAVTDGEVRAFRHFLPVCMIALRDTFGFGSDRLQRFAAEAIKRWQLLDHDEIALADEAEALYDETGIRFRSRESPDGGVVLSVDVDNNWKRPRPPSMRELLEAQEACDGMAPGRGECHN